MFLLHSPRLPLFLVVLLILNVPVEPGAGVSGSTGAACPHSSQMTSLTVPSAVYKHAVQVSVYLPPCYETTTKLLPVIYLLHGGGADETQWPDLHVQAEADALIAEGAQPFVVVMPGGNYEAGLDYADFILAELLPAMNDRLSIRTDPAGRAIGGLSLGGYWALSLAFHHLGQFAAVGGYSPVVRNASDDLVGWVRTTTGLSRLHIALDVGSLDSLAAGTRQLTQALWARGLSVSFTIHPGGHNRPYWRSHTRDYLIFMLASLTSPLYPSQS